MAALVGSVTSSLSGAIIVILVCFLLAAVLVAITAPRLRHTSKSRVWVRRYYGGEWHEELQDRE